MVKRWKQMMAAGVALVALSGGGVAYAQEDGVDEDPSQSEQFFDLLVDYGVLQVVDVGGGDPRSVVPRTDDSPVVLGFEILGASSVAVPLIDLDPAGDGFVSTTDLFQRPGGAAVSAPAVTRGVPFDHIGPGDRVITVNFPQTDEHLTAGATFRWTTIEVSEPFWTLPGVNEVGLWYSIFGLPVLPFIDGVDLPGVGNGFATAAVFQDGTPMPVYAQVDAASGRPINYQPAHVMAWWEEFDRFFVAFGTGLSTDVEFTAVASSSPTPTDSSSYTFQEIDLSQIDLTAVEIEQILQAFEDAGISGSDTAAAEPVDAPVAEADPPAIDDVTESAAAAVAETDSEARTEAQESTAVADAGQGGGEGDGDEGGGIAPGIIAVPLVVAGIVVGSILYVRRRDPETGEISLDRLQPVAVDRNDAVGRALAELHLESGGAVGPNEMFVPTYEDVADVLRTFPDGDDQDIFMFRMLNEHLYGRPLGATLPTDLREEINAHVYPDPEDPELMKLSGVFPNSHFGRVVATVSRSDGSCLFPKDSVIAIHAPTGRAYWVPRSALPNRPPTLAPAVEDEGEAMMASVSDEVIAL